MVNLGEIKELVKEHDKCLKKTDIIMNAKSKSIWLDVVNANSERFRLSDDEIEELNDYIDNKGLDIENRIQKLFKSNNK